MERICLPSPIPPAHIRNDKSLHTNSTQRPQNDAGNYPRSPHGRDTRSPGPGHRSRNSHKINSPKVGYSHSHSQGLSVSRPTSPSQTRTVAVPQRTRTPQPAPEVIIPRAIHPGQLQNKKVSTVVVNRSHSHHPDRSSRFPESQRSDNHCSQSQQRACPTEPESDFSPDLSSSRQGFVHRFTTQIPSRSRSRPSRASTPVLLDPSIYPRTSNKQISGPPSSECLAGDVMNKAPIHASDVKQTNQSDIEDNASQDGKVTADLDGQYPGTGVKEERIRYVKDQDRRFRLLEDELAAVRRELDDEKQRRMTLELQTQTQQQGEKQSRMIQTESQNDLRSDTTGVTPKNNVQHIWGVQRTDKQDPRREEEATKWNELQSDMKKVQDVLSEVRGKVAKMNIDMQLIPGMEKAIDEFRRENGEQRELLNSLSEICRANAARRQDENDSSQEKTLFNAQTNPDNCNKLVTNEVLMLLSEVGKLREERRVLQHGLGSLPCMKSKYGPGGELDSDWTPVLPGTSVTVVPPPEPLFSPEVSVPQSKQTWRAKFGRTKKKETTAVSDGLNT